MMYENHSRRLVPHFYLISAKNDLKELKSRNLVYYINFEISPLRYIIKYNLIPPDGVGVISFQNCAR
jgi:hypothetical protein